MTSRCRTSACASTVASSSASREKSAERSDGAIFTGGIRAKDLTIKAEGRRQRAEVIWERFRSNHGGLFLCSTPHWARKIQRARKSLLPSALCLLRGG